FPISNVCQYQYTALLVGRLGAVAPMSHTLTSLLGSKPLGGMDQKLVGYGIAGTLSAPNRGRSGKENPSPVTIAGRYLRLLPARVFHKSIVDRHARPLRIASVHLSDETSDVWCLTVPGAESFSLENGAIV